MNSWIKANIDRIKQRPARPIQAVFFLCLVIIISYIGVKMYAAKNYQDSYSIDFNENNFNNQSLPLYINEATSSAKFAGFNVDQGSSSTVAQISGTPLAFVFQPKEFPLNKTITFGATIKDSNDWSISLVCPECSPENKYNWQPFYYGWLGNYNKVATFGDVNIYAMADGNSFKNEENLDDWIKDNVTNKNTVSVLDQAVPLSKFENTDIDFHEGSSTVIDKTFRGEHDFYVYLKDAMDLTVIKKDMNQYVGKDDVNVALYDLDNSLVNKDTIQDDGIEATGTLAVPVIKKINWLVPHTGIYRLSLEEADQKNILNDWTITYLKINTNKIVFSNENPIFFLATTKLYADVDSITPINFNIWWSGQKQTVTLKNQTSATDIDLNEQDFNKQRSATLSPGITEVSFRGNLRISGTFFAVNKDNLFKVWKTGLSTGGGGDVIFSTMNLTKTHDGYIDVYKPLSEDDLQRLKITKSINFQLKSGQLNNNFSLLYSWLEKGYEKYSEFGQFALYTKKENIKPDTTSPPNLSSWIKEEILDGSTLENLSSFNLSKSDLLGINLVTENDGASPDFVLFDSTKNQPASFMKIGIGIK